MDGILGGMPKTKCGNPAAPLEEGWKLLVISHHARGRDIESRNCWVGMVARLSHSPLITPS